MIADNNRLCRKNPAAYDEASDISALRATSVYLFPFKSLVGIYYIHLISGGNFRRK